MDTTLQQALGGHPIDTMITNHSPFPWTTKKTPHGSIRLVDGNGITFGAVFNCEDGDTAVHRNAAMVTALPGLLMAAMRGHGWGDPLHQEAHPDCDMCKAIRQAVGPLTRDRVVELAVADCGHVSEMIFEERWDDVWIHLGIHPDSKHPEYLRLSEEGEYEALDADLVMALPNA